MKRTVLFLCFCLVFSAAFAQKSETKNVPLEAAQWVFAPGTVEFIREKELPAMKILPEAGKVVAKDLDFSDGTIEFDVKPNSLTFYFHYQDAKENECFYLRMNRAGNSTALEGIQYAPLIDGVLLWDIYPHYQSNATFTRGDWNHIKLVISGAQMRIYVNDNEQPALEVEHLAGNPKRGSIAFEGDMVVSNLVVTPGKTEALSSLPGMDPTNNDPRYIRKWAVTNPVPIPENVDFSYDLLPSPETSWSVLEAERRGLMNLTRTFGENEARSIIWLKVNIQSIEEQKKKMNLGFLDGVWVFLNGQILYLDKNLQGRLMEKDPGGRCSVDNTSFMLPLKEGPNELLIGLANDPSWGRGMIARMGDMEGIEIKPDPTFDARLIELPEAIVRTYAGEYVFPNGTKMQVAVKGKYLHFSNESTLSTMLYPEADNKFFSRDFGFEIEFAKNKEDNVTHFIVYSNGQQVGQGKRIE
ncbi:uncharacterized protein DUF3471 [Anseongella ginsenosidimutans]|uniref:Uncharacterized protein DUF3471 n=1 Tax=Anseongella ginsenosidimutans TaxID=496056 RepID=A0A4R3KLX9_9SPHI|nr:DUF3471 domain-containing protein [Anseongella ginsenosidimutans]QEC51922.1 DUF3471 domain-containing protein [Anseongella ginsenosidimutans]TCS85052.1 uncharacterized protein DUF3471 [Anseongella ginsenosidimutans]